MVDAGDLADVLDVVGDVGERGARRGCAAAAPGGEPSTAAEVARVEPAPPASARPARAASPRGLRDTKPARTSPCTRRRCRRSAASTSSGTLRGMVGTARAPRSGRRSPAPRATSSACAHRVGGDVREVDEHAEPVHLARRPRAERRSARRARGSSVAESAQAMFVVVGQRQVAHAEPVQHPQHAERVVDRVPALGAEQRGDPARRPDAAPRRRRWRELQVVGVARDQAVDRSICSSVGGDGRRRRRSVAGT